MKTKRIQVQAPAETKGDQTGKSKKGNNYFLIALLFLIPFLIFAGALGLFLAGPSFQAPYECELGRFSGTAEVYSRKTRDWITITRRSHRQIALYPRDKIRTSADGDLDLNVPAALDLRLKQSSEVEVLPNRRAFNRSRGQELKLKLLRGSILGMPNKSPDDQALSIDTPAFLATIRHTSFLIQVNPKKQSSFGVLEGAAEVRPRNSKEVIQVKTLETLTASKGKTAVSKPRRVNYQEWRMLSEARDLITVSSEQVAEQLDLRKKAGSLFNYVFDEGVFYKPNWGYANREFYQEETGEVRLRMDYDVYPQDSYSGMYFKIRDLDLAKIRHLSFSLKADSGKPLPEQFRIEFKDKFSTVRGFAVKPITYDWRFYAFDFNAQRPTPISEMVFVFENSRVGPLSTNGTFFVKDLTIE